MFSANKEFRVHNIAVVAPRLIFLNQVLSHFFESGVHGFQNLINAC